MVEEMLNLCECCGGESGNLPVKMYPAHIGSPHVCTAHRMVRICDDCASRTWSVLKHKLGIEGYVSNGTEKDCDWGDD